ncbi:MAG: cytidylyltransferase domain-containing protein [Pyrinomonadaceae bacterium]
MRTICLIQARMGSTRLRGKVLQLILGRPMLWWDVYRINRCRFVDQVVIATTTDERDDVIVELCQREGWAYSRGSEDDVLDRYYQAAKEWDAECIVRITSDCPLIDPQVSDYVIAGFHSAAPHLDYASNIAQRTYPRGLDTEVFSRQALERAWHEDGSIQRREHVTPFIAQQPDKFRLHSICNPVDYSQHRWTVDTAEDLALVRLVYEHFGHGDFGWQDVLSVLEEYPQWSEINRHIRQKAG